MMTRRLFLVSTLLFGLFSGVAWTETQVEDYSGTINDFKQIDSVKPYFSSAYGYAVFPTIGKGGLGIGGAYGKGQVYRAGKVTGFISMSDLSIGFQAGAQAYSQVVFFQNQKAYDDFTSGNFEFSASASAVAVTASVQAQTGTGGGASAGASSSASSGGKQATAEYSDGLLIFVLGKGGLMYEAVISGQKYKFKPL